MLRRNDFACKRLEVFIVFHLPVMFPAAGASGRLLGFEFFPDEEGRLPEFDGLVRRGEFDPIRQWLTENWYRYGQIYTNDFCRYDLKHPFSSLYKDKLSKRMVSAPVEICGTAFEGPFIRREVVEKIGLPNKDLFIFCDDTDYCLRTVRAGYKILYVPDALMDKQKFFSCD